MSKLENLIGQKFGKLTVLDRAPNDKIHTMWNCVCDCGNKKAIRAQSLKLGLSKSCGCLMNDPDYVDPRFNDLTGLVFNKLTVLGYSHSGGDRKSFFKCRCECGNETIVCGSHLKNGNTKSCGCIQPEAARLAKTTHGGSQGRHPLYSTWKNIVTRCTNPEVPTFKYYGAKGVKICDKWANDFAAFAADIGLPPTHLHTIDRINVEGNYEPGNVRWATPKEQNLNKRTTIKITFRGFHVPLKEVCEFLRIDYNTAHTRIVRKGENADVAIADMLSIASKEPTHIPEWARREDTQSNL